MCADQTHFNRHPEQAAKRRVELFVVEVRGTEHQKAPQAGSHKSLMYLSEAKELLYHNGCKFTYVGVDQIRRRPLAVLLFEIAVKGTAYPKTTGNFKKQNFDGLLANLSSRVTKSAHCLRYMECHIPPT